MERYWPGGSPKSTSLDAFVMMFGTFGYAVTESPVFEAGFDRIALYVNAHGQVTHAARQLSASEWTSKLGENFDVSHTLDALEGGVYGTVAKTLKKPSASPVA